MRTHSSNLCTARRNSLDSDTRLGRIPQQCTSKTLQLRKKRDLLLVHVCIIFFSPGSRSSRIYTQKTCPRVFTWNRFVWTLTVFLASCGLAKTVPSADGMTWVFASLFADVTPRWNQVHQVVKVYGVGWAAEIEIKAQFIYLKNLFTNWTHQSCRVRSGEGKEILHVRFFQLFRIF